MLRRSVVLALFVFAAPVVAAAAPPTASAVHPAASAHATAMAGQTNAALIEACVEASKAFLDDLTRGDYKAATSNFDSKMKSFGPEQLGEVWKSIATHYGKLESRGAPQNVMYRGHVLVTVPMHFQNGTLGARMACNASGKFAGFHVLPTASAAPPASR